MAKVTIKFEQQKDANDELLPLPQPGPALRRLAQGLVQVAAEIGDTARGDIALVIDSKPDSGAHARVSVAGGPFEDDDRSFEIVA